MTSKVVNGVPAAQTNQSRRNSAPGSSASRRGSSGVQGQGERSKCGGETLESNHRKKLKKDEHVPSHHHNLTNGQATSAERRGSSDKQIYPVVLGNKENSQSKNGVKEEHVEKKKKKKRKKKKGGGGSVNGNGSQGGGVETGKPADCNGNEHVCSGGGEINVKGTIVKTEGLENNKTKTLSHTNSEENNDATEDDLSSRRRENGFHDICIEASLSAVNTDKNVSLKTKCVLHNNSEENPADDCIDRDENSMQSNYSIDIDHSTLSNVPTLDKESGIDSEKSIEYSENVNSINEVAFDGSGNVTNAEGTSDMPVETLDHEYTVSKTTNAPEKQETSDTEASRQPSDDSNRKNNPDVSNDNSSLSGHNVSGDDGLQLPETENTESLVTSISLQDLIPSDDLVIIEANEQLEQENVMSNTKESENGTIINVINLVNEDQNRADGYMHQHPENTEVNVSIHKKKNELGLLERHIVINHPSDTIDNGNEDPSSCLINTKQSNCETSIFDFFASKSPAGFSIRDEIFKDMKRNGVNTNSSARNLEKVFDIESKTNNSVISADNVANTGLSCEKPGYGDVYKVNTGVIEHVDSQHGTDETVKDITGISEEIKNSSASMTQKQHPMTATCSRANSTVEVGDSDYSKTSNKTDTTPLADNNDNERKSSMSIIDDSTSHSGTSEGGVNSSLNEREERLPSGNAADKTYSSDDMVNGTSIDTSTSVDICTTSDGESTSTTDGNTSISSIDSTPDASSTQPVKQRGQDKHDSHNDHNDALAQLQAHAQAQQAKANLMVTSLRARLHKRDLELRAAREGHERQLSAVVAHLLRLEGEMQREQKEVLEALAGRDEIIMRQKTAIQDLTDKNERLMKALQESQAAAQKTQQNGYVSIRDHGNKVVMRNAKGRNSERSVKASSGEYGNKSAEKPKVRFTTAMLERLRRHKSSLELYRSEPLEPLVEGTLRYFNSQDNLVDEEDEEEENAISTSGAGKKDNGHVPNGNKVNHDDKSRTEDSEVVKRREGTLTQKQRCMSLVDYPFTDAFQEREGEDMVTGSSESCFEEGFCSSPSWMSKHDSGLSSSMTSLNSSGERSGWSRRWSSSGVCPVGGGIGAGGKSSRLSSSASPLNPPTAFPFPSPSADVSASHSSITSPDSPPYNFNELAKSRSVPHALPTVTENTAGGHKERPHSITSVELFARDLARNSYRDTHNNNNNNNNRTATATSTTGTNLSPVGSVSSLNSVSSSTSPMPVTSSSSSSSESNPFKSFKNVFKRRGSKKKRSVALEQPTNQETVKQYFKKHDMP